MTGAPDYSDSSSQYEFERVVRAIHLTLGDAPTEEQVLALSAWAERAMTVGALRAMVSSDFRGYRPLSSRLSSIDRERVLEEAEAILQEEGLFEVEAPLERPVWTGPCGEQGCEECTPGGFVLKYMIDGPLEVEVEDVIDAASAYWSPREIKIALITFLTTGLLLGIGSRLTVNRDWDDPGGRHAH